MTQEIDKATSTEDVLRWSDCGTKVQSPMHANGYKVLIESGDVLTADMILFSLEAMKMEISAKVTPELVGLIVTSDLLLPGQIVKPGDNLGLCKAATEQTMTE